MKKFFMVFVFTVILLVSHSFSQGCNQKEKSLKYLRSNLNFLASDLLEGRETSTSGESLAAMYIAGELAKYGCKPFGDSGTYFENINLLATTLYNNSTIQFIDLKGYSQTLSLGDDFYLSIKNVPSEKYSNIESSIIFAGYGISAKQYKYDDYSSLNCKGKTVLILNGTPVKNNKSLFSKEDTKKYDDSYYKMSNAMEHGAIGLIMISDKSLSRYWRWLKARTLSKSFHLIQDNDKATTTDKDLIPFVIITEQVSKELLNGEKYSFDSLSVLVEKNEIPESFELNKKVEMNYKVYRETKSAKNIIGLIEGNNDNLKNEYVVLSAHYDHLGIVRGEIYNGADDNGSGTVAILEAARKISCAHNNKRSVLIIFHTGEEKGLLGSKYLTDHADFMKNIDADINIDMVGRGSTDSIFCIGSNKLSSEMHNIVEQVDSETVHFVFNYKYDDPNDPNRYYYRSDHYNYAKHNIPIVFFYDHMTKDYHKPTDDVDKINFEKIVKVSTLVTELANRIANKDHKLVIDKTDVNPVEENK